MNEMTINKNKITTIVIPNDTVKDVFGIDDGKVMVFQKEGVHKDDMKSLSTHFHNSIVFENEKQLWVMVKKEVK